MLVDEYNFFTGFPEKIFPFTMQIVAQLAAIAELGEGERMGSIVPGT
jgi:hypothetical protein